MSYGASQTPPPAAPPPPPSRSPATQYVAQTRDLKYHPFAAHIAGGYSLTTGTTDRYLDNGPNVGFGLTWFPTSALPIGLRVDGSYSWFGAKGALLDAGGIRYTHGQEELYGGDADLQLDLAHRSSHYKLYLFGGPGWYRERLHLRQVSWERGIVCSFFYCAHGWVPVVTAEARTTGPWRTSWNAGLGWEIALADHSSFFLEARYLSIGPSDSRMKFVPIRVGLRF